MFSALRAALGYAAACEWRAAVCGPELQNRHAFERPIVWAPVSVNHRHPGIFDAKLLFEERELVLRALQITSQSRPGVRIVHHEASSMHDGNVGQGDDMQDNHVDVLVPILGKRKCDRVRINVTKSSKWTLDPAVNEGHHYHMAAKRW